MKNQESSMEQSLLQKGTQQKCLKIIYHRSLSLGECSTFSFLAASAVIRPPSQPFIKVELAHVQEENGPTGGDQVIFVMLNGHLCQKC